MRKRDDRIQDQDGAVLVEFAAVFVLFAMLVSGLIQYGVIFAVQQSVTHAASEAARVVVDIPDLDGDGSTANDAEDKVMEAIDDQLQWLDGSIDRADGRRVDVTIECDGCTDGAAGCDECLDVTVTFNWADDAIVPTIFPVGTPDRLQSSASVEYQ